MNLLSEIMALSNSRKMLRSRYQAEYVSIEGKEEDAKSLIYPDQQNVPFDIVGNRLRTKNLVGLHI